MDAVDDTLARIQRMQLLAEKIELCKLHISNLPELEREYKAMHAGLIKTLESVDVLASGNFGWERRTVDFLIEFRKRVLSKPMIEP